MKQSVHLTRSRPGFTHVELPVVSKRKRKRKAFTLVELLVVIAIIGVLVAILLPAVQAAREAARKKQCANNLKQMAIAFLSHESSHKYLPTGGWGYLWIGEPDIGYDAYQPGGWAYNILAFMEEKPLRELGTGYAFSDPAREEALMKLVTTPVSIFNCPSKRHLTLYPLVASSNVGYPSLAFNLQSCEINKCYVFRGDYRVNSGSNSSGESRGPDPASPLSGELQKSQWHDAYREWVSQKGNQNGISYAMSMVRMTDILDGSAHTAMLGEKRLNILDYENGDASDDDQCVYTGFDRDNIGFTANGSQTRRPLPDAYEKDEDTSYHFGSSHPDGVNMAFCDGAVRLIDFEIDPKVFKLFGGRNDE